MAVHHVDVNPMGAGALGFLNLLAQSGKVRGEDTRGYVDHGATFLLKIGHCHLLIFILPRFAPTAYCKSQNAYGCFRKWISPAGYWASKVKFAAASRANILP